MNSTTLDGEEGSLSCPLIPFFDSRFYFAPPDSLYFASLDFLGSYSPFFHLPSSFFLVDRVLLLKSSALLFSIPFPTSSFSFACLELVCARLFWTRLRLARVQLFFFSFCRSVHR
jgi:hypothetical protein